MFNQLPSVMFIVRSSRNQAILVLVIFLVKLLGQEHLEILYIIRKVKNAESDELEIAYESA